MTRFAKAIAAVLLAGTATVANAASYVFLWDYTSPLTLAGITYENGVEIQNFVVGSQYGGPYGLWNDQLLVSDFSAGFNITDRNGNLIHTYAVSGTAGTPDFFPTFLSSEVGPLTALAGGVTVVATGGIQTVYNFATADDTYELQFRTDLGVVPEPASWTLMIAGFGLVGGALRRRTAVAA